MFKFLKNNWKNIHHRKLWIDSMVGMTLGFVSTLVVGTIVGLLAIGQSNPFSEFILQAKKVMTYLTPFAIGVGVGYKAKLKPIQILSIMIGTGISSHSLFAPSFENNNINWGAKIGIDTSIAKPGDVFGAWIVSVIWVYIFNIFVWDFVLDIILVPMLGIILGLLESTFIIYATSTVTVLLEYVIDNSINDKRWLAILLSPIIGVIMGTALSLPTSSAAMAYALNLSGDAATASMAATAAQMLSWGVLTYLATNSKMKAITVAFGTSMIQMPNFMKKPKLLIIPAIASASMAILATSLTPLAFPTQDVTSGMGSCGLFGQIFTLHENGWNNYKAWTHVFVFQLISPAILTLIIGKFAIKKQWIKKVEMEI